MFFGKKIDIEKIGNLLSSILSKFILEVLPPS